MKTFKYSLIISSLLVACSVQAESAVTIYGRIDTGIAYDNYGGDTHKDNTITMQSGLNTASRIGIKGIEEITDDLSVGFRLENRFASDSGALKGGLKGNKIFEGCSYLTVSSKKFGEVSAGRISGISSGSGAYDLQFFMDSFGGGTYGIGLAPVKSSRIDNMITYRTPMLAGFQGTLQYSMKTEESEEGDENTSDVDKFYAGGLRYKNGNLNLVAAYEETTWGKKVPAAAKGTTSKKIATIGGSYRFKPVTVYLQGQYFDGVNKLDGFSSAKNIKGFGTYAGTQLWFGLSSWQSMIFYRDYKVNTINNIEDHKAHMLGIATKYLYRPSKSIDIYIGGGFSTWDGQNAKTKKFTKDHAFNIITGITKYF